jgi:arginine N-succinyltransferase
LLSGEARDAIGKVGTATEPVKHMLEKIGFRWKQHIDPFDGGPHYWADTDKISIVRNTKKNKIHRDLLKRKTKEIALCGTFAKDQFRCIQCSIEVSRGGVRLQKQAIEALQVEAGDPVYVMPIS